MNAVEQAICLSSLPPASLTMSGMLKPAILIVSETASNDPSTDRTGGLLKDTFATAGDTWLSPQLKIVPDDVRQIQKTTLNWTDNVDAFVNLIVTSGGTGFAEKDVTPEVCSLIGVKGNAY